MILFSSESDAMPEIELALCWSSSSAFKLLKAASAASTAALKFVLILSQ